jgi:hypothetical protein
MTNLRLLLGCAPLAFLAVTACEKNVGDTVRPDPKTGSQALGEDGKPTFDCSAVAPAAEPLVVDWPDHHRADLGITMQEGVAVVHYGCDGLTLLKHCKIDGTYRYAGSQLLTRVVELETADAVQASLPVQGATFAAEIAGDSKIDIATAIIGRLGTLVSAPARSELVGECDGATHYVRSAYVGAFAMATGTKGKAMVAAEVFKASASAESSSKQAQLAKDGDLSACEAHDPDSDAPPGKCRSAVRIELYPIAEKASEQVAQGDVEGDVAVDVAAPPPPGGDPGRAASSARPGAKPKPAKAEEGLVNTCADGFVPTAGGGCTRKGSGQAYRCDRNDFEDCKTQCEKGSADSCYNAALGPLSRVPVAPNSPEYAARKAEERPFYEKACEGKVGLACNSLGLLHSSKNGGAYDPAKARTYYEKACNELFFGTACLHLANLVLEGKPPVKKDPKLAVKLMARACDLGTANGCVKQGEWQITGNKGVAKNPGKGTEVLEAACNQSKDWYACQTLADLYREGKHLKKDEAATTRLQARACELGSANKACK